MIRLITITQVIDISFTSTEENVDNAIVKDFIIEAAQLRWIKPALGDDLWDLLETENGSFSTDNQALVDRLVTPLAFFVKYESVPDMVVNSTSAGLQTLDTEYSKSATDKQTGNIRDTSLTLAKVLLEEVVRWIEKDENITKYPTYSIVGNVTYDTTIRGGIVF